MATRAIARRRIVYRRPRTHRRAKMSMSLAMLAGFAPTVMYAYDGYKQQGANEGLARVVARLTGYSSIENKFKLNELVSGWLPVLGGVVVHKLANRTGLNRQVRKLTMGLVSI